MKPPSSPPRDMRAVIGWCGFLLALALVPLTGNYVTGLIAEILIFAIFAMTEARVLSSAGESVMNTATAR